MNNTLIKVGAVSAVVFVLMLLLTSCVVLETPLYELVRQIQGEDFPIIWIVLAVCSVLPVYLMLYRYMQRQRDRLTQSIHNTVITHTELQHLVTYNYSMYASGYYLLRLFCQGIVRFSMHESNEIRESRVTIDEERLEEIKRSTPAVIRRLRCRWYA